MNAQALKHYEFWRMARHASESPGGVASKILADWLDEHDSPLRAHILRHGSPEHIVGDGDPGVLLHDEERHVRPLEGVWNPEEMHNHNPRATHEDGPETYELFRAAPTVPGAEARDVVRYTLRMPGRHLRIIAPVSTEHIRAIGDAFDAHHADDVQTPWNAWHQIAMWNEHPTVGHTDRATPLARLKMGPGTPNGQPFGGGGAIIEHPIHDEGGKQVGRVRLQPRGNGTILHVHWIEGGALGTEAMRSMVPELRRHYPDAHVVSGLRVSGFRGQPNAQTVDFPLTPEGREALRSKRAKKHARDTAGAHLASTSNPTHLARDTYRVEKRKVVEPVWRRKDTALWIDPSGKSHMLGQNQTHTDWLAANKNMIPGMEDVPDTEMIDHAFKSGWLRATLSGDAVLAHNDRVPSINTSQLRALKDHATTTGASELHLMTGNGDRVVRLARVQATPNGSIVNNTFQRGGQFMAKARMRIRDVAARLIKLARTPAPADVSVQGLFGRTPSGAPLTLGELKKIEDTHKLPAGKRLSQIVKQPEGQTGDDKPFNAGTPAVQRFLKDLSAHKIGKGALKKLLADPGVKPGVKLTHLVTHLSSDYASAEHPEEGGSWYGGQVSALDRAIHRVAAQGKDHPLWGSMDGAGELKGKEHPDQNHPGMVLLKAVIAATSGNQNPTDNLASALKAWDAGRAAGHPIVHMPDYNHAALSDWVARVKRLHGLRHNDTKSDAAIRNPGTDPHAKAAWYAKWVLPFEEQLAGKGVVGWAAHQARINTKTGRAVWVEKNNKIVPVDKRSDTGDAKIVGLPFTYDGSLRPKGWGMYGTQVAERLAPLKALFRYEQDRNPRGTELEHMRAVANWLVSEHTPDEFDRMSKNVAAYKSDLPHLKPHLLESKALFNKGWTDEKGATLPGTFILGPKFGSFAMNLHSNDPSTREKWRRFLTADKWWTRNFFRYLGDMKESPQPADRRLMKKAVEELCARLGTTPADLQADLWYHEKNLYGMLGAGARSSENQSYREASDTLLGPTGALRKVRLSREDEQAAFHEAMAKDQNDHVTRSVYADWLREQPEAHLRQAGERLHWWAQVLPHMKTPVQTAMSGERAGGGLYLPEWARQVVIQHYTRGYVHKPESRHSHDELSALGIVPLRGDGDEHHTGSAKWWSDYLHSEPAVWRFRNTHMAAAQYVNKKLGLKVPE